MNAKNMAARRERELAEAEAGHCYAYDVILESNSNRVISCMHS